MRESAEPEEEDGRRLFLRTESVFFNYGSVLGSKYIEVLEECELRCLPCGGAVLLNKFGENWRFLEKSMNRNVRVLLNIVGTVKYERRQPFPFRE